MRSCSWLCVVLCVLSASCRKGGEAEGAWSFVVLADSRSQSVTWRALLTEVRDRTVQASPPFPEARLLVTVGDQDPNKQNHDDFLAVFGTAEVPYYPAMGNHDVEVAGDAQYLVDTILPAQPGVVSRGGDASFYVDHANLRLVVMDQYSGPLGSGGCLNAAGVAWAKQAVEGAAADQQIVVAFHAPAFPRGRGLETSFNRCPAERDALWRFLVADRRVRAVFVGHTHIYSRLRVRDPSSDEADAPDRYPDQPKGLWQVDVGNAGNFSLLEAKVTFVRVEVRKDDLRLGVFQAPVTLDTSGKLAFQVTDLFEIGER